MKFSIAQLRDTRCAAYLIAEIGVNHNGDLELARRLVRAAKEAGADAVKFQTFTAEGLASRGTPKVAYQRQTTDPGESHFEMIRRLELSHEAHGHLFRHCADEGIDFLSTPYDIDSVRFLDALGVGAFKVASADIVDLPLLETIAATGKPTILSCGMATLGEIELALATLRRGGGGDLALLHCVSNYPCADESLNLRVLPILAGTFQVVVGFSDHTADVHAAPLAVALGAKIVERHFTLDKSLPGPDHRASSTPDEFAELTARVRRTERMLGDGVKRCQREEQEMARVSRKSLVLRRDVAPGEEITAELLCLKRPGTGLLARDLPLVLGRHARHAIEADRLLSIVDVE